MLLGADLVGEARGMVAVVEVEDIGDGVEGGRSPLTLFHSLSSVRVFLHSEGVFVRRCSVAKGDLLAMRSTISSLSCSIPKCYTTENTYNYFAFHKQGRVSARRISVNTSFWT
jgi:hypothetical protein